MYIVICSKFVGVLIVVMVWVFVIVIGIWEGDEGCVSDIGMFFIV